MQYVHNSIWNSPILRQITHSAPDAIAEIRGNPAHPLIRGFSYFYTTTLGCWVIVMLQNLPQNTPFFGLHIHQNGRCEENFETAGGHYGDGRHPEHRGDLPPLINSNGRAISMFLNSNFTIEQLLNRALIIHAKRDDFTSQPAGDSGERIACGVIKKCSEI